MNLHTDETVKGQKKQKIWLITGVPLVLEKLNAQAVLDKGDIIVINFPNRTGS